MISLARLLLKESAVAGPDPETFVRRFTRVWSDPEPDDFADLWADGGVLLHPTMARAIPKAEIPGYLRRLKAVAPDIRLQPNAWAAHGDQVFIEWTITATRRGGETAEWSGVDRFTLRGDRAIEGIAYFDTAPLWARIDPSLDRGDLLDAAAEAAATAAATS
jgi:SnoaL-like domain